MTIWQPCTRGNSRKSNAFAGSVTLAIGEKTPLKRATCATKCLQHLARGSDPISVLWKQPAGRHVGAFQLCVALELVSQSANEGIQRSTGAHNNLLKLLVLAAGSSGCDISFKFCTAQRISVANSCLPFCSATCFYTYQRAFLSEKYYMPRNHKLVMHAVPVVEQNFLMHQIALLCLGLYLSCVGSVTQAPKTDVVSAVQMDRQQRALLCLALLALLAPFAAAVLSKGAQVQGFATFYGGPQVWQIWHLAC